MRKVVRASSRRILRAGHASTVARQARILRIAEHELTIIRIKAHNNLVRIVRKNNTKVVRNGRARYSVWLQVDHQSFELNPTYATCRRDANWMAQMLAVALVRLKWPSVGLNPSKQIPLGMLFEAGLVRRP